jgi:hypothetical protein
MLHKFTKSMSRGNITALKSKVEAEPSTSYVAKYVSV